MSSETQGFLSLTSAYSTGVIAAILLISYALMRSFAPARSTSVDRFTFVWLLFDGLVHFTFEGAFLFNSTFGRTVATSDNLLAEMVKEYAKADFRWAFADETVVSLEILTVLGAGPLCFYIVYLLSKDDLRRHYWIIVLCTAEIYGGWMTFCPEWLTGSKNLRTDNWLHLWFYLAFMNLVWVFVPGYLMYDSYKVLSSHLSVPVPDTVAVAKVVKDITPPPKSVDIPLDTEEEVSPVQSLKSSLSLKASLNIPDEEDEEPPQVVRRQRKKQPVITQISDDGTNPGDVSLGGVGARVKVRRRMVRNRE